MSEMTPTFEYVVQGSSGDGWTDLSSYSSEAVAREGRKRLEKFGGWSSFRIIRRPIEVLP